MTIMTVTEVSGEESSENEIIISPTKRRNPSDGSFLQFVLISFTFSWLLWLPGSFLFRNLGENLYSINSLIIIGGFGPFIASFYLTYKQRSRRTI